MACLIQLIKPTEIIELQFNDDGVETVESHFTSKLVQSTFEASCQLVIIVAEKLFLHFINV